jgi:UDP:flavonoid glycosyltransferase YjiC (YdhE family)
MPSTAVQPAAPRDFLFATWQGGGNLPPVLTVAARLLARGHRVRVISDACDRADVEATAGAEFVPWRRAPSRPDRTAASDLMRDWEAGSPEEVIARLRDRIMCGPALDYARGLLAELDRRPADLVVGSEMLLGVMAACEARGQPLALLAANLSILPIPGVPPFGPGLLPARGAAEARLHAEIAEGTLGLLNLGLPALNGARRALGLAPLPDVSGQFAAAARLLLATARAFDFPAERVPDFIRYVGPQLGEPAWAAGPWASPWPAGDPRPLALVAFSTTFQDHAAVLQRVLDAVAGLPRLRALATLGPALDGAGLRAPPNAALVPSAPHDAVLRQASLVVTHGGHGTVMRALAHGVPLLCMPLGRDQADNAVRVAARGAGLTLAPAAPAEEIRAALGRLLGEDGFRDAARRLGAAVAAEASSLAVVDELEALAGGPTRMAAAA